MLNRRLLMAQAGATPPGGGIVTDGLVFHLDGMDKGENPAIWRELINGYEFVLENVDLENNAVTFRGERDGKRSWGYADLPASCFSLSGTFQIVLDFFETNGNNTHQVFCCPHYTLGGEWGPGSFICSISASDEIRFNTSSGNYGLSSGINIGAHTMSCSYTNVWIDKRKLKTNAGWAYGNINKKVTIGTRDRWDSGFRGKVFAIRIYDHVLSEAEILQNQQYDIDTYFGGVIPE